MEGPPDVSPTDVCGDDLENPEESRSTVITDDKDCWQYYYEEGATYIVNGSIASFIMMYILF